MTLLGHAIAQILLLLPLAPVTSAPPPPPSVAEPVETAPAKPLHPASEVRPSPAISEPRRELLACIRKYEQGRAGYATNTGNGYYGAYQFDLRTWRSVGGAGYPHNASPAEQDARALRLFRERGLQPWPTPRRKCAGLRG